MKKKTQMLKDPPNLFFITIYKKKKIFFRTATPPLREPKRVGGVFYDDGIREDNGRGDGKGLIYGSGDTVR